MIQIDRPKLETGNEDSKLLLIFHQGFAEMVEICPSISEHEEERSPNVGHLLNAHNEFHIVHHYFALFMAN